MGFVRFLSAWYPRAVLSLERGFYLLCICCVHILYSRSTT